MQSKGILHCADFKTSGPAEPATPSQAVRGVYLKFEEIKPFTIPITPSGLTWIWLQKVGFLGTLSQKPILLYV